MEGREKYYKTVFLLILLAAFSIRVYYSLTTPLLETDGSIALLNARVFDEKGIIPPEGPSASILNAFLFRIFGETILVGKLGDTAASLAILIIAYFFSLKAYNERTALFAAFFITFSPLNILFSIMAKPYMMLSFFIMLSAFLLFLGSQKNRYFYIVFGALCIPVAFGFRTFSIFSFLAAGLILLAGFLYKFCEYDRKEMSPVYPAVYIFFGLIFFSPILFWRIKRLGFYFFRDFGMPDWLKSQDFAYIQKWENVEHHFMDSAFLFLPVFLIFIYCLFKNREKILPNIIIFCFPVSFVILLLINSGHHFPRILVPAIPFFCIMSAVLIDSVLSSLSSPLNKALLAALPISMWIYMAGNLSGPFRTEVSTTSGVMRMVVHIALSFTVSYIIAFVVCRDSKFHKNTVSILVFFLLSGFAVDGLKRSNSRINVLSSSIMPYISAIEKAPSSGEARGILYENNPFGMLSGKDSKDLRNLALSDGIRFLSGDFIPVAQKNSLSYFIIPGFKYADGIFYTYRDMSIRHGGTEPKMHEEMYASSELDRVYDNSIIINLFYPLSMRPESPSPYTDRSIKVGSFFGRRGDSFVEAYFSPRNSVGKPEKVILKNISADEAELIYRIDTADSVIEAESFYEKGDKEINPWFPAYSHWSVGKKYLNDYFYGNSAMVFPFSEKIGEWALGRKLHYSAGCYRIFAKISYRGEKYSRLNAELLFDGKVLNKFSADELADSNDLLYAGSVNIQNDSDINIVLKVDVDSYVNESFLVFDRLVFYRSDCNEDDTSDNDFSDTSPKPLAEGRITIKPGDAKPIEIPEVAESGKHIEFTAYNPENMLSYLLYYKVRD